MNTPTQDSGYLKMCYALAEKARGNTSPNPHVGAVVVQQDTILGWGYHEKAGRPHAETIALQRAGKQARGATAYITMEPCTQWGRTPPCIDQILKAGLKRVVVSDFDPNPKVYRQGVRRMRAAGIQVSTGLLKEKNKKLNEFYIKYITRRLPFVTLKTAASLDGKIATRTFTSQWITSPGTRDYIHLVRGEYDALLVGINTILQDDPRLTVRHSLWWNKQQIRIILDSQLRFPPHARILDTLPKGDILIFTGPDVSPEKAAVLREKGAEVIAAPLQKNGRIELQAVLEWLGRHEISSVLVEGGGQIHTDFLENRLADKMLVSLAPKLIGGLQAPGYFQGEGISDLQKALQLKKTRFFRIENDILVEGYF